jgi:hypothetical protein
VDRLAYFSTADDAYAEHCRGGRCYGTHGTVGGTVVGRVDLPSAGMKEMIFDGEEGKETVMIAKYRRCEE